ncbi:hypothetical protein N665_0172s0041 [Sinapis alba]|nr:hypothetical protein N665_0172s0041 [Sinapis alba]
MTLLWKKPKSGRLSRFISEFQLSPKRGEIMVVETGFPTSLIDLFFKNRDRLKKYSSKTKRIQRLIETAPNASLPVNPDVSLEKPVARSKIEKVSLLGGGLTAEKNKHTSDNSVCVCGDGTGAFVLMAFKLFIVAVLALSTTTKNLTMGIALCAFALLFTENVATRILTRFKLCNTDTRKEKPLDDKLINSCSEETEPIAVTKNSNSNDSRIRDLSLKDEKTRSKTSRLKSKILKKLRSYIKKKKKTIVIKEETLTDDDVSSLVPEDKSDVIESERDEENSNPPLIESKGDDMNGIVVIVIVLTGDDDMFGFWSAYVYIMQKRKTIKLFFAAITSDRDSGEAVPESYREQGVEMVKEKSEPGKLTVTKDVDPTKLMEKLEEKIKTTTRTLKTRTKTMKTRTKKSNTEEKKPKKVKL